MQTNTTYPTPGGVDPEELDRHIAEKYRDVANEARGDLHFPTGRDRSFPARPPWHRPSFGYLASAPSAADAVAAIVPEPHDILHRALRQAQAPCCKHWLFCLHQRADERLCRLARPAEAATPRRPPLQSANGDLWPAPAPHPERASRETVAGRPASP